MNTVPNKPKTPIRGVRVPDEEWVPAQEKAKANGETMTDVVRRAIRAYNDPLAGPFPKPGMNEKEVAEAVMAQLRAIIKRGGGDDA